MGAAIAARLASVGHEMMVWNRNADKARATGFKVAETPQALAAGCEVVISILTDAAAVQSVYGQLLTGEVEGKAVHRDEHGAARGRAENLVAW